MSAYDALPRYLFIPPATCFTDLPPICTLLLTIPTKIQLTELQTSIERILSLLHHIFHISSKNEQQYYICAGGGITEYTCSLYLQWKCIQLQKQLQHKNIIHNQDRDIITQLHHTIQQKQQQSQQILLGVMYHISCIFQHIAQSLNIPSHADIEQVQHDIASLASQSSSSSSSPITCFHAYSHVTQSYEAIYEIDSSDNSLQLSDHTLFDLLDLKREIIANALETSDILLRMDAIICDTR